VVEHKVLGREHAPHRVQPREPLRENRVVSSWQWRERIFADVMTSDHELKASVVGLEYGQTFTMRSWIHL